MAKDTEFVCIVTVVQRGWGDKVLESARAAGAEGATVAFGRGVGVHEHQQILGIPIEPEKEIIFTVVPRAIARNILDSIARDVDIERPGQGISFILPVEGMAGIAHAEHKHDIQLD